MAYDFPAYIADLTLAAHKARNTGSHGSAAMLDEQLAFAIHDAKRAGEITDPHEFQTKVAHRVVERGGAGLFDLLHQAKPGPTS